MKSLNDSQVQLNSIGGGETNMVRRGVVTGSGSGSCPSPSLLDPPQTWLVQDDQNSVPPDLGPKIQQTLKHPSSLDSDNK